MKTYSVKNMKGQAVVTEFWDEEPVRKYKYRCMYYGGDILVFMSENSRYLISEKTNISAMSRWCGISRDSLR